jgi:hypothetical protein
MEIVLSRDTVRSPDTLTGSIRVEDGDGIDSVWVTVDTVRRGEDALFDRVFTSPFRFAIGGGHVLGDRIPVRVQARDIVGYVGVLDTVVIVRGP